MNSHNSISLRLVPCCIIVCHKYYPLISSIMISIICCILACHADLHLCAYMYCAAVCIVISTCYYMMFSLYYACMCAAKCESKNGRRSPPVYKSYGKQDAATQIGSSTWAYNEQPQQYFPSISSMLHNCVP